MKIFFRKIIIFLFFLFPFFVSASVRINEIAWMGTGGHSEDEWIELYNDGTASVDVANFTLIWKGGETKIVFKDKCKAGKMSIPAGGYFLLERTDGTTLPNDEDCVYAGSLRDSGENMVLSDGAVEIDRVDGTRGGENVPWQLNDTAEQVGDKTSGSKKTAQRTSSGLWITAVATPGALNTENKTAEPSSPEDTTTAENSPSSPEATTVASPSPSYSYSAHSDSAELSEYAEKEKLYLTAGRDRIVLVGTPVLFSGILADKDGNKAKDVSFFWSFGDGRHSSGREISHTYENVGEYVAILTAETVGEKYVSRSFVKAVSPDFAISVIDDNGHSALEITNELPYEVNLKEWAIRNGVYTYKFLSDTIILPGKKLIFSSGFLGFDLKASDLPELVSSLGAVSARAKNKEVSVAFPDKEFRGISGSAVTGKTFAVATSSEAVLISVSDAELLGKELASLREKLSVVRGGLLAGPSFVGHSSEKSIRVLATTSVPVPGSHKENSGSEVFSSSSPTTTKIVLIPNSAREGIFRRFIKFFFRR